jgi:hypothetical protein
VCIVGPEGKVEWKYSTGQCNDLWALPNGNLLFMRTASSVQLLDVPGDATQGEVWH